MRRSTQRRLYSRPRSIKVHRAAIETLEARQLLSAGYLDSSFGDAGIQNIQTGAASQTGGAAVQSTGKIVLLTGSTANEVQRLQTGGETDTTFGTNGFATLPSPGSNYYTSITVESDDKIIAYGPDVIARLNANGTVDTTFGGTGAINTPVSYLAVQSNEAIVVSEAGNFFSGYFSPGVYRINGNGLRDGSFNNNTGSAALPIDTANGYTEVGGVAITPSQQIVVSVVQGETSANEGMVQSQYGVVRLLASGSVDTTFGTNGLALNGDGIDLYPTNQADDDMPAQIGVDSNGAIYQLGGVRDDEYEPDGFYLLAYTPSGGTAGTGAVGLGASNVSGFAIQPNNEVVTLAAERTDLDVGGNYLELHCYESYSPADQTALVPDTGFDNSSLDGNNPGESDIVFPPVDSGDNGNADMVNPESISTSPDGQLIIDAFFQGTVSNIQRMAAVDQGTNSTPSTGTVEGSISNDANNTGESGVTVYDDLNNNGQLDAGEPSTTTDVSGNFSLAVPAGNQIIRQVLPAGQTQTSPTNNLGHHITVQAGAVTDNVNFTDHATSIASIGGTVSLNSGGTGNGWEVYLDLNNNGTQDSNEPSTTTDTSGYYDFTNLSAGNYIVRVISPSGYTQVSPANNYGQHVSVSAGQTLTNANFLFGPVQAAGSIVGSVTFTDDEPAPAGTTLYLDLNNNGKEDSGEPSTTTDAEGNYQFNVATTGNYIVRLIAPSGASQLVPANNLGHHVAITPTNGLVYADFTLLAPDHGVITGEVTNDTGPIPEGWQVYLDLNNDGKLDNGEPVTGVSGSGNYEFDNLAAGNYIVRVIPAAGFTQITPANNLGHHVTLVNGEIDNQVNFEFAGPGSGEIRGYVQTNGPTSAQNWTVLLDDAQTGDELQAAATESDGSFYFFNLANGNYVVTVDPDPGYVQVAPANNAGEPVTITADDQDVSGVDFTFDTTGSGTVTGQSLFSAVSIENQDLIQT